MLTSKTSKQERPKRLLPESITLYEYFRQRLGVDEESCRAVLEVLSEFLLLKAAKKVPARVPYLGKFEHKTKRSKGSLIYTPTLKMAEFVEEVTDTKYISALKKLRERFKVLKTPREINLSKIEEELRCDCPESYKKALRKRIKENPLRLEFFRYLQRDFPLQTSWVHPYTKIEYQWEEIKEAVFNAREKYPRGYAALYTLWINVEDRKQEMSFYDLNEQNIWTEIYKVIDLCLGLLTLKDLQPKEVKRILRL